MRYLRHRLNLSPLFRLSRVLIGRRRLASLPLLSLFNRLLLPRDLHRALLIGHALLVLTAPFNLVYLIQLRLMLLCFPPLLPIPFFLHLALLDLQQRSLPRSAGRPQHYQAERRNYPAGLSKHDCPSINSRSHFIRKKDGILRYNPSVAARLIISALLLTAGLNAADVWTWWVDDCSGPAARSGCNKDDSQLARWAFEAWQRESRDQIVFRKSTSAEHARLTIHWSTGASLYGETRPVTVDGKQGAEIYILPGANATRAADSLLRDTIIFLTFVHETGHALGLPHTSNFADIMYTFQYGGDIEEYFARYRRQLKQRSDIALHSGLSDGDRQALALAVHNPQH